MKKLIMIVAMVGVIGMAGAANAAPIVQDDDTSGALSGAGWTLYTGNTDFNTGEAAAGGDDGYTYSRGPTAGTWTPGLTGTYLVETTWCVGHGDTDYYFDSDGPGVDAEVFIVSVHQTLNAGQSVAGTSPFSGLFELGTFELNTGSVFLIKCPDWPGAITPITTGIWQFSEPGGAVPEPAGLGLIGLALLAVRRKRS